MNCISFLFLGNLKLKNVVVNFGNQENTKNVGGNHNHAVAIDVIDKSGNLT